MEWAEQLTIITDKEKNRSIDSLIEKNESYIFNSFQLSVVRKLELGKKKRMSNTNYS